MVNPVINDEFPEKFNANNNEINVANFIEEEKADKNEKVKNNQKFEGKSKEIFVSVPNLKKKEMPQMNMDERSKFIVFNKSS